jgi:hypothetical protein
VTVTEALLKFSLQAIAEAVAVHISADLAPRLRELAKYTQTVAGEGAAFTPEELGELLALGLCSDSKASSIDHLSLAAVHLHGAQGTAVLEPDDAFTHPLLSLWLRPTFAALLGVVLRSGALMANLTPGWPLFERVTLVESDGVVVNATARVIFRDIEAAADLVFGGLADTNRLLVHKVIGGDGLFGAGMALREGLANQPPAIGFATPETPAVILH